jgi:hypothetical protein
LTASKRAPESQAGRAATPSTRWSPMPSAHGNPRQPARRCRMRQRRPVAVPSVPVFELLRHRCRALRRLPFEERVAWAAANPRPIVRALFVGGDFPRKGGLELLKAWRSSNLGSRAALDIVTDWPLEPEDLPPGVSLIRGVYRNTGGDRQPSHRGSVPCGRLSNPQRFGIGWGCPPTNGLQKSPIRT